MDEEITNEDVIEYLSCKALDKMQEELGDIMPAKIVMASLCHALMVTSSSCDITPREFKDFMQEAVLHYIEF